MDRGGRPYGTTLDRQSNPIAEQGGVYMGADFDVGAKIALQRQNKQIGPSAYRGAENEQVWHVATNDIMFTLQGSHGKGEAKMAVLGTLCGQAAEATARYANDPRAHEIIRLAVKNRIQVVGVSYQSLETDRGNVERGITVQMGGLRTLPLGNNQFGEEMAADNVLKPGDLVCADVPVPGREGLMPGPGSHARKGVPFDRYTLQMRRCSPQSSGNTLMLVIHQILADPAKWKVAMGERLAGTRAWASAAAEVMNSYLTAGVLFTRQLLADGLLAVSARGARVAANDAIGTAVTNANAIANGAAPVTDEQARTLSGAADIFAAHLAELLNVIPAFEYTGAGTPAAALSASANATDRQLAGTLGKLRMELLQRIFYSGDNLAFEFGFVPNDAQNRASSNARFARNGVVRSSTSRGALLEAQLSHAPRAVAGFHRAILDDLRFMLGKAATGATSHGSGNAHIFLGKYA